jgi:hypothetical protein
MVAAWAEELKAKRTKSNFLIMGSVVKLNSVEFSRQLSNFIQKKGGFEKSPETVNNSYKKNLRNWRQNTTLI